MNLLKDNISILNIYSQITFNALKILWKLHAVLINNCFNLVIWTRHTNLLQIEYWLHSIRSIDKWFSWASYDPQPPALKWNFLERGIESSFNAIICLCYDLIKLNFHLEIKFMTKEHHVYNASLENKITIKYFPHMQLNATVNWKKLCFHLFIVSTKIYFPVCRIQTDKILSNFNYFFFLSFVSHR